MLRRTPLKTNTPLRRGGPLARKTRIKQRRAKPRRSSRKVDKAHLAFVRTLPCCAPVLGCGAPSVPHHATHNRGKGQKASDDETLPLCRAHHSERHRLTGAFKGWSQERVRSWEAEQVAAVLAKRPAANTQTRESEEDAAYGRGNSKERTEYETDAPAAF